mmetsp:Transcript_39289/g.104125  ORF Transcript_39289/g.104125 Transcript_39289/m.104125 type:complete len:167 (+) Transcript_39289:93-593(+)
MHVYRTALPLPGLRGDTGDDTANADPADLNSALKEGHRLVSNASIKLHKLGVHVAGENALLYNDKNGEVAQKEFPYPDGLQDTLQSAKAARQHQPLIDFHSGGTRLEDEGVNVNGVFQPRDNFNWEDFFGLTPDKDDKGAQKLAKAGVRVDQAEPLSGYHSPRPGQ